MNMTRTEYLMTVYSWFAGTQHLETAMSEARDWLDLLESCGVMA
jgi:hypothetical protein